MAEVRQAVVDDAIAIGEIHVKSWQATYPGIFPSEFLDGLSVPSLQAWWSQRLERPVDRGAVLVAEVDNEVVGFASVGPSLSLGPSGSFGSLGDPEGEVYAIYLAPRYFRIGVGRKLIEASERSLVGIGFSAAILWVVDSNQRARSFYEAVGWSSDGALKLEEIGGVQVTELRYRKRLS